MVFIFRATFLLDTAGYDSKLLLVVYVKVFAIAHNAIPLKMEVALAHRKAALEAIPSFTAGAFAIDLIDNLDTLKIAIGAGCIVGLEPL